MPVAFPQDPIDISKAIESGSKRVGELATGLSRRIRVFEEWLNTLPGRVEAECWTPIARSDLSDLSELEKISKKFGPRFSQSGKLWTLFCSYRSLPGFA